MSLHIDSGRQSPPQQAAASAKLDLLLALTQAPTAAGREHRVIDWVTHWVARRPELSLSADGVGNLVISFRSAKSPRAARATSRTRPRSGPAPLFITAHLDHPAFVVERVDAALGRLELSFRGGVQDVFFEHAPITLHLGHPAPPAPAGPPALTGPTSSTTLAATLVGPADPPESPAGKHYVAELDDAGPEALAQVRPGDIAVWTLPPAEIDARGIVHTPVCDDLAAAAAALAALDDLLILRRAGQPISDVRVLLTRSEEIGFIGAIAACRLGTIPRGSRVLALENSRAFPDSPVGGGPIVRVGDRLSIFTPWLTTACAQRAEEVFSGPAGPSAVQTRADAAARPWQRKLMAGGACEASVFCHAGYDATCLCLPLGNYHNMPHLDLLQAGTYDATTLGPPRCEREFIHTEDYLGLIDLLVALAIRPPEPASAGLPGASGSLGERLDKMYRERSYVLGVPAAKPGKPKARAKPAKTRTQNKTTPKPKTKAGAKAKAGPKPAARRRAAGAKPGRRPRR